MPAATLLATEEDEKKKKNPFAKKDDAPEEMDDDGDGDDDLFDDDDIVGDEGDTDDETPAAEAPGEPPPVAPKPEETTADVAAKTLGGDDEKVKKVIMGLAKHGIVLPDDTDKESFWDRAEAALLTADHHRAIVEAEAAEADANRPPAENAQEESRPILMSTATAKTPTEKLLMQNAEKQARKARLAKITNLTKRGMPVVEAERLKPLASEYMLSLDPATAKPKRRQIDIVLSTWDKALPGEKFTDAYLNDNAHEEERPDGVVNAKNMGDVAKETAAKYSARK